MGKTHSCKKLLMVLIVSFLIVLPRVSPAELEVSDEGKVTVNFQDVDIRTVAKSVAKITGRSFLLDPDIKGNVTIISSEPVSENELYPLFLAILQVHDFVAIDSDNVTKIIPLVRAKHDNFTVIDSEGDQSPADSVVTIIYKLQYVAADQLVPILRPLVPAKCYLAAQVDSNMLIISDRKANIDRLTEIIKKIDLEESGDIEIMKLEYADAGEVVSVIEGLEGKANPKRNDKSLRLIADARTNSILLSGSSYNILRIKTLITHLDSPIESEGTTQVIFLRYAKAKDLVDILRGVDAQSADKKNIKPSSQRTDLMIQADESTNALIINAAPAVMKNIRAVIRTLDIRRTQVLIEAIIAEVSTDKGAELGVQWRLTDMTNSSDDGFIGGTNFNTGDASPGINILSGDPVSGVMGLNGFNLGYVKGTASILGNTVLNIGTLVSALAADGDANILSTPSLVTMDNEEAEIVVGKNVPFATGSYTSTGSSNPQNPFTTYERHDVGVKLKVMPQINEDDTIRLDIVQEVSNLTSVATDGGPITNNRTIKTIVMMDNGKILVLGGLISDDVSEVEQRVPILGSIPLIGYFFRYTKTGHNKQNLMVFLKATILRDENDSNKITFDKYDYMRRLQIDYREDGISLMPDEVSPVMDEIKKIE
ncbi:MAG: type II secretion system secretin GspD [Proteobacteria bacterium]|nr:type II secretion system secretin GspD [Pseudomonadota bacterium]MBU1716962.1 type II secretion system secretin GspD [Pseudomonadota bacterium]